MNIILSVIFFSSIFLVDGYSYENGTLKCPNETIGQTFLVPELNNSYTKVNDTTFRDYKTDNQFDKFETLCTTNITDMSFIFNEIVFNSNISTWDTSNVRTMAGMFFASSAFDQDISKWNTENVKEMYEMFSEATTFNQDLSKWNTGNVYDMTWMFGGAWSFNQDVSNWDTSSVTDMADMFNNATLFNQSLTNWCVKNVTGKTDFSLNSPIGLIPEFQPLWNGIGCTYKCHNGAIRNITDETDYSCICNGDFVGLYCNHTPTGYSYENGTLKCPYQTIGQTFYVSELNNNYTKVNNSMLNDYKINNQYNNFTTSCITGITTLNNMFDSKFDFNSDISTWDTSSVYEMAAMFVDAQNFNQDISNWDTSSVIDMAAMFTEAIAFDKDISNWDTSRVTDMSNMFSSTNTFNQNISNWDTSSVTDMDYMFSNARAFNQNISNWDTSSVTTMNHMFFDALTFNQSLTNWCVSSNVANANFSLNSPIGLIPEFQPLWNGIGCTHKCHNGAIRNISDKTDYSCICNGDFVGLYCNHTPTTATTTTTTTTTTTPAPVIFTVPVIIGIVCGGIVLVAGLGYLVRMFVLKITTQTGYILQVVTPADL